jgi:tetratricopeptide (TPR) repeat protein
VSDASVGHSPTLASRLQVYTWNMPHPDDRRTRTQFRSWMLIALMALESCAQRAKPDRAPVPVQQTGAIAFSISCRPDVQAAFDHAVELLHHMTYAQARTEFREIAERDPQCAMAHWGIAMTLFQPLWPTRPSAADLASGWQSARKARELAPKSAREQGFIEAIVAFFENPGAGDYWQRIDRWEAKMKALQTAYPDDPEVRAFCALALLASARPGPAVQEHSEQALALLLPVYQRNPNHAGAMHYIIHANDVQGRERENSDVLQRYEENAPDNPHALHMPTHIYTRLGDWQGVIRGNLRAAEAALRYPVGNRGDLVWDEFAHAIEYLVYAYLQQGSDRQAAAQIDRLLATPNIEPSAKTAFHLASTRARYALERRAWREAAALVPRQPAVVDWDRFPWPEAVTWFARGYGALKSGDASEPPRALTQLKALEQRASAAGETIFARQIQVLGWNLEGWMAHAANDDALAVNLLRQSAELEASTPKPAVTPAPTLPAPELLGDLLLELGRADEALAAYRQSLQRFPRRFNGTLGVARALAATGDKQGAAEMYRQLLALGCDGTRTDALDDVRPFAKGKAACSERR